MDEFAELRRSLHRPPRARESAPPPPRPGAVPGQLAPDDPARYFQPPDRSRAQISPLWAVAAIAVLILAVLLFTPESVREASRPKPRVETPEQRVESTCRAIYHATYDKPVAQLSRKDADLMAHCETLGYYKP